VQPLPTQSVPSLVGRQAIDFRLLDTLLLSEAWDVYRMRSGGTRAGHVIKRKTARVASQAAVLATGVSWTPPQKAAGIQLADRLRKA